MKREKFIYCLKFIAMVIILLAICIAMGVVVEDKSSKRYKGDIYLGTNNPDVLYLGTSHVLYGIYPEVIDSEYNIESYNVGGYAQRMATSYWCLVNALEKNSPKLVVVDSYSINDDSLYPVDDKDFLHFSTDAIPLSYNKWRMVDDLLDDSSLKFEFLFPFAIYHSRWSDINRYDFDYYKYDNNKGAIVDETVGEYEAAELPLQDELIIQESVSRKYLQRIIDLCEDNNIDVLLISIPFVASEETIKESNSMALVASKNNLNFYNMFYDEKIDLDYTKDFTESTGQHLNSEGAKKISLALGQYIVDNYDF